jgi:hypothetical protein
MQVGGIDLFIATGVDNQQGEGDEARIAAR